MKKIAFIIGILFCSSALIGQYDYYSGSGNLYRQEVIQTQDGGLLIGSYQSCYTPGTTTIEGCINALFLIKTDAQGDTLWTKSIDFYTQYSSGINLFENENNTYTMITTTNQTYICGDIGIGLYGLRQIEVLHIDAAGAVISDVRFPDNCQLTLRDVDRIEDGQFAVLAFYDEPANGNGGNEGRVFIMDDFGTISNQLAFPQEKFGGGQIQLTDSGELLITYSDTDGNLVFLQLDTQLNVLNETVNSELDYSCLLQFSSNVYTQILNNGNLMVFCHEPLSNDQNAHFFLFDDSFQLIAEHSSTLIRPTNFIEGMDNMIVNTSLNEVSDTLTNTQVNYFSATGDSIFSTVILGLENERPYEIRSLQNDQFVIVGSSNCCNMDTIRGAAKAFLSIQEFQVSGVRSPHSSENAVIYPNPTAKEINISLSGLALKREQPIFQIYTITGDLVFNRKINPAKTQLSLGQLPAGLFFYSISTRNGIVAQGKLIKTVGN